MAKKTVSVHEAKTNLSKLLMAVTAGQEIEIARGGVPVARLIPVERSKAKRQPGKYAGQILIEPNFDAPLDSKLRKFFE